MLTPKTKLILVIALLISMLAVLGMTLDSGVTASAKTLKGKLLRRYDKIKLKPDARELDLLRRTSAQEGPQERLVENKIPKHVPLKVKLKAVKEAKIKDLTNSDWVRDFELEVTNISDKPIYYLELWLMLPDTMSENNNPLAFSLRHGRIDFTHFDTRPVATDVPIQPGETHTFAIPEEWQQGWREFKVRRNAPDPKKLHIEFIQLSFGDGSGFDGGGEPYPYKRKQSSTGACREGPRGTAENASTKNGRNPFPALLHQSLLSMPTAVSANFFLVQTAYRQPETEAAPDINCPGTDCIFSKATPVGFSGHGVLIHNICIDLSLLIGI